MFSGDCSVGAAILYRLRHCISRFGDHESCGFESVSCVVDNVPFLGVAILDYSRIYEYYNICKIVKHLAFLNIWTRSLIGKVAGIPL